MKGIRRKSDNVIIFLMEDNVSIEFYQGMLMHLGTLTPSVTPETHEVVYDISEPDIEYVAGTMSYISGVWEIVDVPSYNRAVDSDPVKVNRKRRRQVKGLNKVRTLLRADPNQIANYIDNNVNNLAQAKDLMTTVAQALSIVAQDLFNDEEEDE